MSIKQAIEALELARTGLEWYRVRCPEAVDGSDDEADQEIDAAIAALRSMPESVARTHLPYCYIYEWDGPFGVHQSTSSARYNGMAPARTVPVYATPHTHSACAQRCGDSGDLVSQRHAATTVGFDAVRLGPHSSYRACRPRARGRAIVKFKFIEFNPRRDMRGADAALVEVTCDDGESEWLWMSKRDISKNMMAFERCDELTKAHQAYGGGVVRAAAALAGEAKP